VDSKHPQGANDYKNPVGSPSASPAA
jgi:hypothetical protein